jgi:hypothetical protein
MFETFLTNTIHQYFDTLLRKHGLLYFSQEKDQRDLSFFYKKQGLLVRIKYNFPNNYLDVDLYKETNLNNFLEAENISLDHILKDKKPSHTRLDYISIMPSKIPIEDSLKILSELLAKYGSTYLDGTEWKTWRDIKW